MLAWFAIVIVLIVCALAFSDKKPRNYPPGPLWVPFIGCLIRIRTLYAKKRYYHLVWSSLHRVYGSVVGLKLGLNKIVLLSGYEAVQQVLIKNDCQGRPDGFCFRLRTFGERLGIVFVDGVFIKEQRRFCLHHLRQLGWGKTVMNSIVTKEAIEVTDLIKSECQRGPIQIITLFDVSALNTIWTMIAGHRFSLKDDRLHKLVHLTHETFRMLDMSGGILNQVPLIRYLAPELSGYNSIKAIITELMDFLKEVVKNHREFQGDNFINTFLLEVKNNQDDKNTSFTETTSNTLSFVIYYLLKYPRVQEKIHTELDAAVKPPKIPTMEDRDKLVYLEATIMEVQRHASPVPLTVARRAIQDTTLMNYTIPHNTVILASLWSVHMDENYWKDPHVFRPERFVDNEGKLIQDPHFMPYGLGKRRCIGETLAKTTLFLFLSILLQNFKLEPVSGKQSSVDVLDGITLSLAPFKVNFVPRK